MERLCLSLQTHLPLYCGIYVYFMLYFQAIDDKYSMSEQARQALQIQMLSLHDQIGRLADVPARRNTAPEPTNGL